MSMITISLPDGRLEELHTLSNRSNLTVEEFIYHILDEFVMRSKHDAVDTVNEYPRSTSTPKGVHGKTLMQFVGAIPQDDLAIMHEAIKTECGKIDWDEW